jgi:hypothetical protein
MNDNENKTNAPTIKLPVRLIYVDNILSDTHHIVDVNGKRVSKRAIVAALNEADALRAEVEGYRKALQNLSNAVQKSSLLEAVWMGSGRRDAEVEQIVGANNIARATLKQYAAIKPNAAAGETSDAREQGCDAP